MRIKYATEKLEGVWYRKFAWLLVWNNTHIFWLEDVYCKWEIVSSGGDVAWFYKRAVDNPTNQKDTTGVV